jgi:hypothetical protein
MKMQQPKLTLAEAKGLYAKTGFCDHFFVSEFEIYGCNRMQKACQVCSKIFEEWYK